MTKEKITLKSQIRSENENLKDIRSEGMIPAVMYGPDTENKNLKVYQNEFEKVFNQAGESNLIDLMINDSESVPVLIKDIVRDPVKNFIIHLDLYKVNMKKEITAEIPLHFVGESKAIKEKGGTLVKSLNEVEVTCLPSALIDHFEVDLSVLDDFGDAVRVKDLKVPEGMEVRQDGEDMIVSVIEPTVEVEETVAVEETPEAGEKKEEEIKQ